MLVVLIATTIACNRSISTISQPVSSTAVTGHVTQPAPPATLVTSTTTSTVIAIQSLNMRALPGADKPIIGVLLNGDSVKVIGQCAEDGWVQVEYQKKHGYVNSAFLSGAICHQP